MSEHTEYCHNCGVEIGEPSAFCGSCGAPLAERHIAPATSATAAPGAIPNSDTTRAVPPQSGSRPRQAPATAATATLAQPAAHSADPSPVGSPPAGAQPSSAAPSGARPPAVQQPGTTPPGMAAPGAQPPGIAPPGMAAPGGQPPGTRPPGTPPPGAPSPGEEQPPSRRRNWIPFAAVGAGALVALAVVVVLLLALGGSAGKNVKSASATREQALRLLAADGTTTVSRVAPGLFALVAAGKLTAAVPAGWRATGQIAGEATRAEFANPQHPASTLTIVAQKQAAGNEHNRAVSARQAVGAKGDTVGSLHSVAFPGGRRAWRLTYDTGGVTHQTYFFSACNSGVAMVVDVAAASSTFQQEEASLQAVAANAEPQC